MSVLERPRICAQSQILRLKSENLTDPLSNLTKLFCKDEWTKGG